MTTRSLIKTTLWISAGALLSLATLLGTSPRRERGPRVADRSADAPRLSAVSKSAGQQPNAIFEVNLPQAVGVPSQTPLDVDFGAISFGDGRDLPLKLRNRGVSPLALEFTLTGPSFSFRQDDCPSELAPQATCTVVLRFRPVSTGTHFGALHLGEPGSFPLTGVGLSE